MIPYVRMLNSEAVDSRKSLLSTQMNLLKLSQDIETYKKIRKQEISRKILLRREVRAGLAKLSSLISSLPQGGIMQKKYAIQSKPEKVSKKYRDIEFQLNEIKQKLAGL